MIDDVPSPIDLRDVATAAQWAAEADRKRPHRAEARAAIAALVAGDVLELGCGPGFLAEAILASRPIASYTLFDFSPPMLALARGRVRHPVARFTLGDFKQPGWSAELGTFDAVVAMQAVHEIRHKAHVPGLYRDVFAILRPGGAIAVCDHAPSETMRSPLYATVDEQLAAMTAAGFDAPRLACEQLGLYVVAAIKR